MAQATGAPRGERQLEQVKAPKEEQSMLFAEAIAKPKTRTGAIKRGVWKCRVK